MVLWTGNPTKEDRYNAMEGVKCHEPKERIRTESIRKTTKLH